MLKYTVNPNSDIPVYRQLVDQINAEIRSGVLKTGTQLPTVREMADQLRLSCGTVKRVYDCLQEMGDIEMTRGRGTFVKYVREEKDSRKVKAMRAIDLMIRQLSDLNFSPSEIQIFLNLKMREWGLKWSGIRIALVTDYPDLAPALEKQLSVIGNIDVSIWQTQQLREYPYSVDEQSDVILSPVQEGQLLTSLLPDSDKLILLAFSVLPETLYAMGRCSGEMAVLCQDEAFCALVSSFLPEERRSSVKCIPISAWEQHIDVLRTPAAVLTAPDWESACPDALLTELKRLSGAGRLIPFDYRIDEGSMLYLEEHINRIRTERQLHPGTLQF